MEAVQPARTFFTLANALRTGELPLREYLDQLEERFAAREASIRAFLPEEGRFDRLRREAAELEAKYPNPESRPPLFGIPLGVKDIFHVSGFATQAGSRLPADLLQGTEARSVTRLLEAGALLMGKTVTTEFAYLSPGSTRNPIRLSHTPGGSSSGSAAAVAAGLCSLALGTQTIGSIIRPAAFCGVVGFKPTYDRVTRSGVIPLSPSLDHVGAFSPDVGGADLAASLLCPDWQLVVAHRRPVCGVPEGPYLARATPEGLDHFHHTCRRLEKAGFKIKRAPALGDFEKIYERHYTLLASEAARIHASWFKEHEALYRPAMAKLIRCGQEIAPGRIAEARNARLRLRAELTALMDDHDLDLWLSPAAPGPATEGLDSTGDPVMNLPWTQAGLPVVSLPAGVNAKGLPFGLQITGRWYEDESLLDWAADMESIVQV